MAKSSISGPSHYRKVRSRNTAPWYIWEMELETPKYSEQTSETLSSAPSASKAFYPSTPNSGFNIDLVDAIRRGTGRERIRALEREHLPAIELVLFSDLYQGDEEIARREEMRECLTDLASYRVSQA